MQVSATPRSGLEPGHQFLHYDSGGLLDSLDLGFNIEGCGRGLFSQVLNLIGDYGKTFARLSRSCRLNSGDQSQEVGLLGNLGNDLGGLID